MTSTIREDTASMKRWNSIDQSINRMDRRFDLRVERFDQMLTRLDEVTSRMEDLLGRLEASRPAPKARPARAVARRLRSARAR